ncbi:MAG: D-alanyl-D-alanine carboxypeptidase family protein [Phormidesmis sp.]
MSTRILEDRFELEKKLSHTDFSSVYLACDRHHLHRPHCIVTAIHYRDTALRHRLEREAQILERLGQHPQIPRVLTYFHRALPHDLEQPAFYIVQNRITGHPLSQEITPSKQLSASYVEKLLQDVLVALAFVHSQGVIHQNLHPRHLIRREADGQIFLTEFGTLSKLACSTLNADGTLGSSVPVGLQPYMAPEQLQANPQPSSDLYALGLIAIEALTGCHHHEFTYDPHTGLRWREELARCETSISLPLAEFIDRLIRHDWQGRFTTAAEALSTLQAQIARCQIADDSRLPTIIAAPGVKPSISKDTQTIHRPVPKNPYIFKMATGSIAVVLALGIGVKTYQWGEYRISRLPQTWQAWKQQSASYPVASPDELTPLLKDGSIVMRPAAAEAFWQMVVAARSDGVGLYPLSGYRAGDTALQNADYVTGYALDIGGESEATDRQASFADSDAFRWLTTHAKSHGFELSTANDSEPWHWRYVGDEFSQSVLGAGDR